MVKLSMTMKCTFIATCYDRLPDAPVQHQANHPIEEVQGFTRSHRMLLSSLGKYLLHIRLTDSKVTWKNIAKNLQYFAGHFNGRGGVPVQYFYFRGVTYWWDQKE